MADVFTRRCGCGAILSLRESCARCAAAERARLHASGIGVSERDERQRVELRAREAARGRWDELKLPERREYFCVPPPGERALEAAQDEARTQREIARIKPPPTPAEREIARLREHEPPPVGAEVSYETALEDMKRRPEARYRSSIESGTYCFDGRLLYWPESGGVFDSRNSEGFNRTMHWTRLPDATTVPEIA